MFNGVLPRLKLFAFSLVAVLCLAGPARAEVLAAGDGGFSVQHSVETAASRETAWDMLVNHIKDWWNPEHSWSGDAANLYITPEIGGCFCERLPGGGVEHLRIIFLKPEVEIHFDGALGPLQSMAVEGRMLWKIDASEAGSTISFTYLVHGFSTQGFEAIAPAVDGVIGEQLARLAQRLENL